MTAKVLEGPAVANAIDENSASRIERLKLLGITPTLAIVRVGDNESDIAYEKGAANRAEKIGITVKPIHLGGDIEQSELISIIEDINSDDQIHGLLLLRPLPKHIDESRICNAISPAKDVDACTDVSLSSLFTGANVGFAPCTAQAVIEMLDYYDIDIEGKDVVVVGRSLVIGKPIAMMMLERNATVTISHSCTRDLPAITQAADIIIACIGKSEMFGGEYFSDGQCVVDVGINFAEDGRMTGDVAYDEATSIVDAITPVPRGVGSVTTSVLCRHVIQSAEQH